jgi:hypothetical protein
MEYMKLIYQLLINTYKMYPEKKAIKMYIRIFN